MKNIIRGLVFCFILSHASLHAQEIDFYAPVKAFHANTIIESVTSGDIDNDGITDLIVGGYDTLYALKGNGDGSFTVLWKINAGSYYHLVLADMTNDGKLDIVFPVKGYNMGLLVNSGNGNFGALKQYALGGNSNELSVADFDHDGYLDVAAATEDELDPHYKYMAVFINNKNGTLKAGVLYSVPYVPYDDEPVVSGYHVNTLDMDDDGYADIIQPYEGYDSTLIYYNKKDGTFNDPVSMLITPGVTTTQVKDLDHDGQMDVIAIGEKFRSVVRPDYMFGFYLQKSGDADQNIVREYVNPYDGELSGLNIVSDVNQDGEYDLTLTTICCYDENTNTAIDSFNVYLNSGNLNFNINVPSYGTQINGGLTSPISDHLNSDQLLDYAYVSNDGSVYIIFQKSLLPTAVESSLQSQTISIYPNPTSGVINLKASADIIFQSVSVFDAMGRMVYREDDFNQAQEVQLSLVNLSKGLYLLQTEQTDGSYTMQHFVIE